MASSPAVRGLGRVHGLCLCQVLGPSEVREDLQELVLEGVREEEPGQLVPGVLQGLSAARPAASERCERIWRTSRSWEWMGLRAGEPGQLVPGVWNGRELPGPANRLVHIQ